MIGVGSACGGLGLARRSGCSPASWLAPSCSAAGAPPSAEARLSVAGATPSPSSCSCWRCCPSPGPGPLAPCARVPRRRALGRLSPALLCPTAAARATHSARSLFTVCAGCVAGAVPPPRRSLSGNLTNGRCPRGPIGCPPGTLLSRHQSHPAAASGSVWILDLDLRSVRPGWPRVGA